MSSKERSGGRPWAVRDGILLDSLGKPLVLSAAVLAEIAACVNCFPHLLAAWHAGVNRLRDLTEQVPMPLLQRELAGEDARLMGKALDRAHGRGGFFNRNTTDMAGYQTE